MDRNIKQEFKHQQQGQKQKQDANMKHNQAAVVTSVSASQLHFFQPTPQTSTLPLPWMMPPYQMMVLPQGVSQQFLAQNFITLPDGQHVMMAPTMDDANGSSQVRFLGYMP